MSITVEIMPILWLGWIIFGIIFIIVGILKLSTHQESEDHYVTLNGQRSTDQLEELFSYFLEEEEKKNQGFRDLLVDIVRKQEDGKDEQSKSLDKQTMGKKANEKLYDEIIMLYENGESIEAIARNLKKGIGEVKLIISLYSMK